MEKAPVLFVGHGNPMNAIGDNPSRKAWKEMGKQLGSHGHRDPGAGNGRICQKKR